jgi:electron-transferring-flavoprotein dehydrogenase
VDDMNQIDILFVGAGPASLAGAIKLKQLLNEKGRNESVVVIEKAYKPGWHNLSGAVFEADVLDELIPGWKEKEDPFVKKMLQNEVKKDATVFLMGSNMAFQIPEFVMPKAMRHEGNYTLSVSEMVNWLTGIATELGVEVFTGFAAESLVTDSNGVQGVKLGDKGLNKEGEKQSNYLAGDILRAKVTVLGEGSLGQLAEDMVKKFNLGNGCNPQIHSVGVKEIIKLPEDNEFGTNRVIHTMGFPSKPSVFGGGTLYSMGDNTVAVAIVLGLDWKYCDLDPQKELQLFKSHSFISNFIKGGEVVAYGARTLPEGGFFSVPDLVTDGALIIGDNAGLTNVKKLKGLHYAIKSGMCAAGAISNAVEKQDFSRNSLKAYRDLLEDSFVMKDLRAARNYRQVFAKAGGAGLYLGAPLSMVQQMFPKLSTEPDYEGMTKARLNRKYEGGIDRLTDVSYSGTTHREDEPSHITFSDPGQCTMCNQKFGCHPCEFFCPGEVYKFEEEELILSPSNCLHCQTCRVKCPEQTIRWRVPEGGDGPRFKVM